MWRVYKISFADVQSILINSNQLRETVHNDKWYYEIKDKKLLDETFDAITYNSKEVSHGSLFICKGEAFKVDYLKEAVNQGVQFYISENYYEDVDATGFIVNDIREVMALVAREFYNRPDEKLKVIGITGTKGKTTTTYLLKNILDTYKPEKTAVISTIEIILDGKNAVRSSLTTPEAMDLFQMIAQAHDNGMEYLVMEVSSQAYKMKRVYGMTFDVGAFLNISPDHIGPNEHPNAEDYFYCKSRLMLHSKVSVLHSSLDHLDYLKELSDTASYKSILYGPDTDINDYTYKKSDEDRRQFQITSEEADCLQLNGEYQINMLGDFNKENALCAAIAASTLGVDQASIQKGIAQTSVPGRMEHFTYGTNEIYVDFAHNYISLKTLFDYVVAEHPDHDLTIVLGAPGNKGLSRRKDMGEILSAYQGRVILTEDDPNREVVRNISEEIAKYIDGPIQVLFNDSREEAIRSILNDLKPEDNQVIVLAAKGSDRFILRHGVKEDYIGDDGLVKQFLDQ